jgi:hypothetical protein
MLVSIPCMELHLRMRIRAKLYSGLVPPAKAMLPNPHSLLLTRDSYAQRMLKLLALHSLEQLWPQKLELQQFVVQR